MSYSREELEKVTSDFSRIANRPENKPAASNMKARLTVMTIIIAVIIVAVVYYVKKMPKKTTAGAVAASPVVQNIPAKPI